MKAAFKEGTELYEGACLMLSESIGCTNIPPIKIIKLSGFPNQHPWKWYILSHIMFCPKSVFYFVEVFIACFIAQLDENTAAGFPPKKVFFKNSVWGIHPFFLLSNEIFSEETKA